MNRILLIVGGLLVGLLAALFLVPVFVDWNRYRGTFEEEATRLLGRDVRVSGKVNLRLLPTPFIRFEKLRVADTRSGTGEPLFKAEDFTVWLAVGPLFAGTLEASEIEVKRPVLNLVLDEQGGGNWSDLAKIEPQASFLPSSVALNAMRITNGTITLNAPGGIERARVQHINGEVSAASLQGPFKVAAAFSTHGAMREIRASTAAPEADGAVRFKGTVRSVETGAAYTLDGRLRDLLGPLKLEGELTAKVPLPRPVVDAAAPAAPATAEAGVVDIKAAVKADTEAIELSDIALAFEQSGRPQLASGTARMAWRQRNDLDLTLTSKWLDLDRISGEEATSRPLAVLARLSRNLGGQLPTDGRNAIRLELDQATLGGEVVSAVSVTLERSGPELRLKSLQAALPGNSRIEASGVLNPEGAESLFEGTTVMRGASLSRMLAWAARGIDASAFGQDGSFVLTGHMRLGEQHFAGRGLTLRLGRHSLTGEAGWTGGDNRKLVLSLDGTELDVTPLTGGEARPLPALRAALERLLPASPEAAAAERPLPPVDVQARVRFGRLLVGPTALTDVAADVAYAGGNLSMPLLRIGHPDEWQIELRGDIAGLMRPGARGSVSGHVYAQSPERLEELLTLLEAPAWLRPQPRRAGFLTPLRLAGRLAIGEKGPEAYDLQFDGRAGHTRAAGTLQLNRSGDSWLDGLSDGAVTLEAADPRHLLTVLLPASLQPDGAASADAARSGPLPARMVLRAIGKPKDGMSSIATFDGAQLAAEFRGRLTVSSTADPVVSGDLRLAAADLGASLTAAGYRPRAPLTAVPATGSIALTATGSRWSLGTADLALASTRVSGGLEIDASASPARLRGNVKTTAASLPKALSLLTTAASGDTRRDGRGGSDWSDGIFDFSALAGLEVAVTLETPHLEIAPGIGVGDARLDVTAHETALALKLPSATALAGALTGELTLQRALAGTHLKGRAVLQGARLETLARVAGARAPGRMDLKLDLSAAAQGPRSLVSALKGGGEISLTEAQLPGLDIAAPRSVAEAVVAAPGEVPAGEVRRQLTAVLSAATLPLGNRKLSVDIVDGIARLAPAVVDSPDGRATGLTVIDLGGLKLDSEWRLEPKPAAADPKPKRPPLPGISVVFAGPLDDLDKITRRLDADAFERELVVRKYERDVEELERIRRLDEERIRQEAERRRIEELERRSRLVEPDPAAPAAPPPPPAEQPRPPRAEPQKQTAVEPPSPRLPPLGPLLAKPDQAPAALTPPGPAPVSGSIPASAEATPPMPAPPPRARRTAPAPPVTTTARDALRDAARNGQ